MKIIKPFFISVCTVQCIVYSVGNVCVTVIIFKGNRIVRFQKKKKKFFFTKVIQDKNPTLIVVVKKWQLKKILRTNNGLLMKING